MKYNSKLYSLSLILVLTLIFGIGLIEAKTNTWEEIIRIEAKHPHTYAGFLNDSFGITVGFGGECHYTIDGGKTWPKAENQSMCRFGLEILDEKNAWHSGNGAQVGGSNDGGKTWNALSSFGGGEPNHCRYISFCNENVGWIASNEVLGVTTDGGKNWTNISWPTNLTQLSAIAGISQDTVYLLDTGVAGGQLFLSKDCGKNWNTTPLGLKTEFYPVMDAPTAAMRFVDNLHGILFIFCKGSQLWQLETTDGGKTWRKLIVPKINSMGNLFLAPDGQTLTISEFSGSLVVLRKKS